jgi:hypothetical protein
MKPKEYAVLVLAVEAGVARGWTQAHKHVESPDSEAIKDQIEQAVTSEICDWFTFDDESKAP